jgi:hypothetical protein
MDSVTETATTRSGLDRVRAAWTQWVVNGFPVTDPAGTSRVIAATIAVLGAVLAAAMVGITRISPDAVEPAALLAAVLAVALSAAMPAIMLPTSGRYRPDRDTGDYADVLRVTVVELNPATLMTIMLAPFLPLPALVLTALAVGWALVARDWLRDRSWYGARPRVKSVLNAAGVPLQSSAIAVIFLFGAWWGTTGWIVGALVWPFVYSLVWVIIQTPLMRAVRADSTTLRQRLTGSDASDMWLLVATQGVAGAGLLATVLTTTFVAVPPVIAGLVLAALVWAAAFVVSWRLSARRASLIIDEFIAAVNAMVAANTMTGAAPVRTALLRRTAHAAVHAFGLVKVEVVASNGIDAQSYAAEPDAAMQEVSAYGATARAALDHDIEETRRRRADDAVLDVADRFVSGTHTLGRLVMYRNVGMYPSMMLSGRNLDRFIEAYRSALNMLYATARRVNDPSETLAALSDQSTAPYIAPFDCLNMDGLNAALTSMLRDSQDQFTTLLIGVEVLLPGEEDGYGNSTYVMATIHTRIRSIAALSNYHSRVGYDRVRNRFWIALSRVGQVVTESLFNEVVSAVKDGPLTGDGIGVGDVEVLLHHATYHAVVERPDGTMSTVRTVEEMVAIVDRELRAKRGQWLAGHVQADPISHDRVAPALNPVSAADFAAGLNSGTVPVGYVPVLRPSDPDGYPAGMEARLLWAPAGMSFTEFSNEDLLDLTRRRVDLQSQAIEHVLADVDTVLRRVRMASDATGNAPGWVTVAVPSTVLFTERLVTALETMNPNPRRRPYLSSSGRSLLVLRTDRVPVGRDTDSLVHRLIALGIRLALPHDTFDQVSGPAAGALAQMTVDEPTSEAMRRDATSADLLRGICAASSVSLLVRVPVAGEGRVAEFGNLADLAQPRAVEPVPAMAAVSLLVPGHGFNPVRASQTG